MSRPVPSAIGRFLGLRGDLAFVGRRDGLIARDLLGRLWRFDEIDDIRELIAALAAP